MKSARTRTSPSPRHGVPDDYLDLVKRFPLRPIRSGKEMEQAGDILDRLVGRDDLTPGQQDYLEALVRFVKDYEERTIQTQLRQLPAIEVLRHLMQANKMTTADLGRVLGSRGLASEVLNGKRGLSKTLMARLAIRFRVDPALFLDADNIETE